MDTQRRRRRRRERTSFNTYSHVKMEVRGTELMLLAEW